MERTQKEIDCLATDLNGNIFAIEHTSIDFLTDHREYEDILEQAIGGVEEEINKKWNRGYRLEILIKYRSIKKGPRYHYIKKALIKWIEEYSLNIEETDGYRDFQISIDNKNNKLEPVPKLIDHLNPLNTIPLPNFTGGIYGKICNKKLSVGVN